MSKPKDCASPPTADAPENDFGVVAPGTKVTIHVLATGRDLEATISRREPAADPITRTVHFELDVPDPEKTLPVGTTGEIRIEVGEPQAATMIPLSSAAVRGTKASVFVVDGDVAHAKVVPVKGEIAGKLYVDTALPPGAKVVTEGRALLADGDKVSAGTEKTAPAASAQAAEGAKP